MRKVAVYWKIKLQIKILQKNSYNFSDGTREKSHARNRANKRNCRIRQKQQENLYIITTMEMSRQRTRFNVSGQTRDECAHGRSSAASPPGRKCTGLDRPGFGRFPRKTARDGRKFPCPLAIPGRSCYNMTRKTKLVKNAAAGAAFPLPDG